MRLYDRSGSGVFEVSVVQHFAGLTGSVLAKEPMSSMRFVQRDRALGQTGQRGARA